jgi:hypothetical protein
LPLLFTWRRLCRAPVGVVDEVRAARILRAQVLGASVHLRGAQKR